MAKVVQFLEIGNLPKSQLNPCRSRKDQRAISAEKCMGSYVPMKKFPQFALVFEAFRVCNTYLLSVLRTERCLMCAEDDVQHQCSIWM